VLGDIFYRLGAITGEVDAQLRGKGGAATAGDAREVAVYDAETGDVHDLEDDARDTVENAAIAAAAAWLLARLFRPRPVSWPRVVLAGIAATALADLVGRTAEEEPEPGREPHADDPEELMGRLGAGVAVAAGYASILYPRIPGSPLFRGLLFGALEILAAPRGGLVNLAAAAPGVKFPLQALALPLDEDAGPLSHLAFGVGLGLFYRYSEDDED
jgi:hypothetical protein